MFSRVKKMEPEESAPEFSPAVDDGLDELRTKYVEQLQYDLANEASSDCPSGACTRNRRSERRELAIKVSDYLMGMAIGALLPELIFYLQSVKLF